MKKILIIALLLASSNLFGQKKVVDKIAAVVGDNIVLQSEIEQQYAQYILQGTKPDPNIKCYIMQSMLSQKLLTKQAVIDSIVVEEADVDSELDKRMRNMISRAGGEQRLEEFLGRPVILYKDEIRPDIHEQLVAQRMQAKITEKVEVTPLDVKKFFEAIPKDSLPTYNTEVEVGEIVVFPKLNKEEKEFYKDKLEALRLRIKNGDNFATLARLYSQDPVSAREGGDLGFFDRQTMAKEFTSWAFKLKPGEISPVFETEFGFHFLEVTERRGESVKARHILIIPDSPPAAMERAKVEIDSIYQKVIDKKVDFSTAASLYSGSNDTKYNGGMLLNYEGPTRTTYIATDKLDPSVFMVVDTMAVGSYSKPYVFTDARNKKGYRFLYLKTKIAPHTANLEQDFPKLKEAAYEEKINRVVSDWFEKRRKSTYIRIDKDFYHCDILKDWINNNTTASANDE